MSSTALSIAHSRLLAPYDLDDRTLQSVFDRLMSANLDHADFYFQAERHESWRLEEGTVKDGSFQINNGVGVRAVAGERTALAFSDDISIGAILQAADTVRAVARSARDGLVNLGQRTADAVARRDLYAVGDPLQSLDARNKVELLMRIDRIARARDPRITHVTAGVVTTQAHVLIMRSDGRIAADIRPLIRLFIEVIAEQNGRRERGAAGGGGRHGYERFDEIYLNAHVDRAVDGALRKLEAIPAPAGTMTVVCAAGWPGVLLHEAVGHGLEGDFNRKGSSAFAGLMGQRVAAPGVTIVDDGTLPGLRGSLNIDDEGNATQRTTLIEDGVLKGFMQDMLNARLMNMPLTGNGRRQSFAHVPLPRMTNTHMLGGNRHPGEIIESVKSGLYAVDFSGGQVDITNGKFVFHATEAYLIENGKLGAPVKGATLIGSGPESLKHISLIGNDAALDKGIATCRKQDQTVPVGVGQPTLRIDNMTVGGAG